MPRVHSRSDGFFSGIEKSLKLYAEHLGWLHATPKNKGDKLKGKSESKPVSRARALPGNSIYLRMPEVGAGKYIVDLWYEVGNCKSGAMSLAPVDWVDLAAYMSFSGINKTEALIIIGMSKEYVSAINRYEDASLPAPYCLDKAVAKQQMRDRVSNQFKALKQSIKAAQ